MSEDCSSGKSRKCNLLLTDHRMGSKCSQTACFRKSRKSHKRTPPAAHCIYCILDMHSHRAFPHNYRKLRNYIFPAANRTANIWGKYNSAVCCRNSRKDHIHNCSEFRHKNRNIPLRKRSHKADIGSVCTFHRCIRQHGCHTLCSTHNIPAFLHRIRKVRSHIHLTSFRTKDSMCMCSPFATSHSAHRVHNRMHFSHHRSFHTFHRYSYPKDFRRIHNSHKDSVRKHRIRTGPHTADNPRSAHLCSIPNPDSFLYTTYHGHEFHIRSRDILRSPLHCNHDLAYPLPVWTQATWTAACRWPSEGSTILQPVS